MCPIQIGELDWISKMVTRRQHYVWRHYLEAWEQKKGIINCLRDGEIFPANPKNVMVERDFYKLPRLTKADVEIFEFFMQETSPKIKEVNLNLIKTLAFLTNANDLIQSQEGISRAVKSDFQTPIIEAEEKLQEQIESDALPILEELRQKQTNFLCNDKTAISFFDFIAHQYCRTKRIRESVGEILSTFPNRDLSHLQNLLCHCFANNIGASLFFDRNEFDIVFLDNTTDLGFITGDQPIVNLMGTRNGTPPEEIALYYPLAPDLASILLPREYKLCSMSIDMIKELNDLIMWESKHFLVSDSTKVLEQYLNNPISGIPPTCRILTNS